MTERERYALWMMINRDCCRYCLCTSRGESAEKADIHWRICRILAAFITCKGGDLLMRGVENSVFGMSEVHKYLTDEITDRMDEVIGLPILEYRSPEYVDANLYGKKFFDWICEHFDEMCELLENKF